MVGLENDAEFNNEIEKMDDRQLSEFTATQLYVLCKKCVIEEKKIKALENRDYKFSIAIGSISGTLGAILTILVDYLAKLPK